MARGMTDAHDDVCYLEALVPVMRRLGVLEHATTKLGPDPQSAAGITDKEATQRNSSPIEQEQQSRQRQRRILTSGGPRLALDPKP
jgi:hypothetical protein